MVSTQLVDADVDHKLGQLLCGLCYGFRAEAKYAEKGDI
jgi:hypothetical protein